MLYLPARDAVVRGSRTMSEEERQKAVDKELVRRGLVLSDGAVLEAMERPGPGGYRFLPLRVSKSTGEITGEALVSAERLGRLEKHTRKVLEEICRELAAGNIAADPFWRGPEKNACRFCDYAAACHFEEGRGGDCRRWLPGGQGPGVLGERRAGDRLREVQQMEHRFYKLEIFCAGGLFRGCPSGPVVGGRRAYRGSMTGA